MKKKFSTKWKASSQPRKQRKYRANAPLHLKKKFVNINLAKDLRKQVGKRNIQVKKGDKVKIMKGKFKGKTGKVLEVNLKFSKIYVEGITATKQDNSKVNVKMQPSNLQIIELTDRMNKKNRMIVKKTENKKTKTPKKAESVSETKSKDSPLKESRTKEKPEENKK